MSMKNKTILTYGLVVLSAFSLVSCGQKDASLGSEFSLENANQSTLTEYTGILQRVQVSNANEGEHPTQYLFISDNNTDGDMYLTTSSMTLDKFLNEEVTIRGYFTDVEKRIFFVADANLKDQNTNTNSNVMRRTYSNTAMGVSFVYPSTWSVQENDAAKITVSATDSTIFTLYKVSARAGESLETWVNRNYPSADSSDFQIGLLVGKKIVSGSTMTIAFSANSSVYSMTSTISSDAAVEREYAELQSSLRTFTPGQEAAQSTNSSTDTSSSTSSGAPSSSTTGGTTNASGISSDGVVTPNTVNPSTNQSGTTSATTPTTPPASTGGQSSSGTPSQVAAIQAPELVKYVQGNISLLPAAGSVKVSKVELAGDNYAYVTYTDGDKPKKVLFQVKKNGQNISLSQVGEFERGTTQSWVTVSGSNPAANTAREVYDIASDGAVATKTNVAEGKSLYTNSQLGFNVQYPKNWYYSGENIASEGGLQKVTFSNKPAGEEAGEKVEVKVYAKGKLNVSGATTTTVGGQQAYVIKDEGGNEQYAIEGKDGRMYVTGSAGTSASNQAMTEIIKSLESK